MARTLRQSWLDEMGRAERAEAQLQQAEEEARVMQLIGVRARRNEKQAQAERDAAIERAEALAEKGQQLREELEEVGNHAAGIVWDDTLLAEWDALKAPAEALAQRGEGDA